jgi:hypothetical protein
MKRMPFRFLSLFLVIATVAAYTVPYGAFAETPEGAGGSVAGTEEPAENIGSGGGGFVR